MQDPPDPITARRLLAMYERKGDDDMFSACLSDEDMASILSPVGNVPCLVVQAGEDEYLASHVTPLSLCQRMVHAIGPLSRAVVVPGAPHSLLGHEEEAVELIRGFVESLGSIADGSGAPS